MVMNIRLAEARDTNQVLALLDELLAEVNKKRVNPVQPTEEQEKREKIFNDLLGRSDVRVFVAEEDSHLLGVADLFILPIMRRGYFAGHLEDLVITERSRGQGVGTALLKAVKDYCRKNQIKVMKLTSGFELAAAHKFYEKQGGVHTEKMFRFNLTD
jgi:GNAT superfamily N-acetyltransferase